MFDDQQTKTGEMEAGKPEMSRVVDFKNMSPEQWLEHIIELWQQGKEKEAKDSMNLFIETYPDYPHEKIKDKLPGDIDISEFIE